MFPPTEQSIFYDDIKVHFEETFSIAIKCHLHNKNNYGIRQYYQIEIKCVGFFLILFHEMPHKKLNTNVSYIVHVINFTKEMCTRFFLNQL